MSSALLTQTHLSVLAACSDMDDAELIVHDCLDEILQKSQDILFDKHIRSQVIPYAIQFVKDSVLHLAKCEFFDKDTVDPLDPIWNQDTEPDPLPFDSWSRGSLAHEYLHNTQQGRVLQATNNKPIVKWNKDLATCSSPISHCSTPSPSKISASAKLTQPSTAYRMPDSTMHRATHQPAADAV